MSEETTKKEYPRYRTSKDLNLKFTPQISVMECAFRHIVKAFGQPTFSTDNNDQFEGTEQCAWQIEFETGDLVLISEERGFGDREHDYRSSKTWKVNTHSQRAYGWVKEIIRDANPNG